MPLNAFFSVFGVERHGDASLSPHHLFDMLSKWLFFNDSAIVGISRAVLAADVSAAQREKAPKSR
ncbi:hypothetical protein [Bifidobacterium callitrichos]|uniref:hypothetical protein n=1 Tax=Bifidobacterium callitrichos TaxID=762209 RepID=UPI0011B25A5B|nr:hypothetical protein [Bifidobacterium callitrichos]